MGALDSPAARQVLEETALRLHTAAHGTKGVIAAQAAERLGVSVQSVYAAIKTRRLCWTKVSRQGEITQRKRREDANSSALSHTEARAIAAYIRESDRKTGKVLADIEAAVEALRANGEILAGRVDKATGEFTALCTTAISRAMRAYGCHPGQLREPAPKIAMATPHPNYCWQIDPSLCVLYYLRGQKGLQAMPHDEFYKNKPANLARVENERVWRYVLVDHCTGAFYVEYVLGAESGENLCTAFINAMQQRGPEDPFCGVPVMVMLDPGSANTGQMFRALCAALGVAVQINQPKQPWVKGSVEKHNDIIECEFEHRLKFHPVESLEQLNAAAWRWMRWFQATRQHSRHRMTRYDAWMRITAEQLVLAPSVEECRTLATHQPILRKVDVRLRVSLQGRRYSVAAVPNVGVGQKLLVARNAWSADSVHILGHDDSGRETFFAAPLVERDAWGFEGAVTMGQYRSAPSTRADIERAAVERVAMEAATDDEAAAKRKAKALPFGGRIDPYKPVTDTPTPSYLPRRGSAAQVDAPAVVELTPSAPPIRPAYTPRLLGHVELARLVKPLFEAEGGTWTPALYAELCRRWPQGAAEEQAAEVAQQLRARNVLRIAQ
jgi:hypothetical protein